MSFPNSPFDNNRSAELEIVATMSHRAIQASIAEQRIQADLIAAVIEAGKQGIPVDDLSEASGLSPDRVRHVLAQTNQPDSLAFLAENR